MGLRGGSDSLKRPAVNISFVHSVSLLYRPLSNDIGNFVLYSADWKND